MSKKNKLENTISPAEEKIVKELITEGRERGFITIDEINENLGDETPSAEQLEKIFSIFSEMDIEVVDNVLTISGERKATRNEDHNYSEFSYGKFSRSFNLPEDAKGDGIKASMKDGVLAISIPRVEPVVPEVKKISIK